MANIKQALDREVRTVCRAEIRSMTARLVSQISQLRMEVSRLTRQCEALRAPASSAARGGRGQADLRAFRPTSADVLRLRKRLKLSQRDFASLLGVAPLSVHLWERRGGSLNLRSRAASALLEATRMSVREAATRLGKSV